MLASKQKHKVNPRQGSPHKRSIASENTRTGVGQNKSLNQQYNAAPVVSLAAVQKKVNVGPPNDAYEQEADKVASQVVSGQKAPAITPLTAVTSTPASGTSTTHAATTQRQAEQDKEVIQPGLIQRQPEEEETVQTQRLQRQDEQQPDDTVQTFALQREPENKEDEPVQRNVIQREEDKEAEESVQTYSLQRNPENQPDSQQESIQEKADMGANRFETNLRVSKSGGEKLDTSTRSSMESGFIADFSHVRIHNDSQSIAMNKSIGARAFTYGNHIYFNRGEYSPGTSAGSHLLAHELTHTVQQGASPKSGGGSVAGMSAAPQTAQRVQRSWLGDAWGAVSGAVSGAVEWVGDSITAAIDYIKNQALDFVQAIPGYRLFTVVYGEDPISGNVVARNGRNFIEAGLDIIPNGEALKQKLESEGALAEAAAWLDNEMLALEGVSPSVIGGELRRFWNGLGISDVARLGEVLQELAGIFMRPVQAVINFAVNVAVKLLEIVKDYVISSLINFIKEQTSAYPLLTVILARDPISNEPVERTPMALFRGFMQLSESGSEQLRQMEESGSLQRAVDWLDGAIARVDISWELIRNSFSAAWDLVTIQNLLNPIGIFRELYNIFAAPVGRIFNFLIEIAAKVLEFIKDALIGRLVAYAHGVRGYPLLTVLLGKDPFSEEPVERNAGNIIHGFMSLMENGEQQYQEMVQSGAIERLNTRVENAIATLNFTWDYIRGLFIQAWERFSLQDLVAPVEAFMRLLAIFGEPLLRLINFIGEIIKIVIEVIMEVMNFPIDLIRNIISRAMQAIEDIKRDPIGFLKNLIRAVKTGFQQFFDNIGTHLLNGLTGWLFSELRDANINPPTDFSFSSILGFVLEVLGITVEKIWEKLAERIGAERVARVRSMIDRLTGIWTFVKDVMTRGPVAIWEYIQGRLSSLWDSVLEAIRNWVVTRIVERVVARLITMLDPTGIMTVINGFIAFYSAVQSFIRYIREMLEIVNSFVVGVAELARGNVTIAANYLENSLANAMPIAIGFLANQVGLSGIGRRIGEMIENVREMVDQGLTWLVDRAVSAGTAFLNTVQNALGLGGAAATAEDESNAENDWRDEEGHFSEDGQEHEVTFNGTTVIVASDNPQTIQALLQQRETQQPALTEQQRANVMSVIQVKIPEINTYKTQHSTAQMNNDSAGMSTAETAISGKLQEIADLLASANIFVAGTATNTAPVYGPEHGGVYGSLARVDRLAHGLTLGTEADSGLFNDNYTALNVRKQGGRSFYVRAHLLSWHLGGPGNQWKNLTPLFQNANNPDHENNFESPVKEAVSPASGASKQVSNFSVQAIYGRSPSSHIAVLEDENNDTKPAGMNDDILPSMMANLLRAETMVPLRLECHADIENSPPLDYTVENPIEYGNLSQYQLNTLSRADFNITDVVNEAATRDEALSRLMTLSRVGPVIAERIYTRVISGKSITNYYDQIGVSKKTLEKYNITKRIKQ